VIGNVTFKQMVTSGEAQEIHVLTPVGVRVGTDASQSVLEPRGESLDQAPSVLFELFANPECAAALATAQFVVASNTSSAIAIDATAGVGMARCRWLLPPLLLRRRFSRVATRDRRFILLAAAGLGDCGVLVRHLHLAQHRYRQL
jgi:hypothetical protein